MVRSEPSTIIHLNPRTLPLILFPYPQNNLLIILSEERSHSWTALQVDFGHCKLHKWPSCFLHLVDLVKVCCLSQLSVLEFKCGGVSESVIRLSEDFRTTATFIKISPVCPLVRLLFFVFCVFLSRLYTQRGAWTTTLRSRVTHSTDRASQVPLWGCYKVNQLSSLGSTFNFRGHIFEKCPAFPTRSIRRRNFSSASKYELSP